MTAPPEPATHSVVAKAFTILLRLWSTKITFLGHQKLALDPIHHFPNVGAGIDIAVWSIPENWQKAPSGALLRLEIIAKLNVILEIIQLRISCSNDCDIGELSLHCLAKSGTTFAFRQCLPHGWRCPLVEETFQGQVLATTLQSLHGSTE